jgi:hypothetical protein
MPNDKPNLPPELIPQEPAPAPEASPSDFNIGEEYGTARKNLPPAKIIGICLGIVVVVVAIFAFLQRPKPSAAGSIDAINAIEIPGQNSVMVTVNVSFRNNGEKPFWIHTMKAELGTPSQTYSDDASPASDFDRYFEGFPALKQGTITPLKLEDKIEPGVEDKGTIIVSFPVTMDAFNTRKSLTVTIWPYDQGVPLIMTK